MPREIFERLRDKWAREFSDVQKEMSECQENISNPKSAIKKAVSLSSNLATAWASGDIDTKEKLQKLVFPEGIAYDKYIDGFRTIKVNSVFELISSLSSITGGNKKGPKASYAGLSLSAEGEGIVLSPAIIINQCDTARKIFRCPNLYLLKKSLEKF